MTFPHDHAGWQTLAAAGSVGAALVVTGVVAVLGDVRAVATAVGVAVARRRPVWGVVVFGLSLAVSGGVTWHGGVPRPVVQDEFSYLLAADTFAHGRVANPTPPGADALQSPHELVRPTYASKYPPGQGIALAVGQVAAGLPIAGAWLTAALAAAAVYWAALAVVPVPWAVVAGTVAAIHPQAVDWTHVYWGGGVAELGGALVVGGAARVRAVRGGWPAVVLGVGLAILANSRPYEGLAFAVPLLFVLGRRVVLPLAVVLVPTGIAMGYVNHRTTGHVLRPPIVEYAREFDVYPKLWFLPKRAVPPAYPNGSMAAVHLGFERGEYDRLRTPGGLAGIGGRRAWRFASDYAGAWVLLVPLAAAAFDRRVRWVGAMLGTLGVALWAETFFLPHYAAPATGAVVVLAVAGWRRLWPPLGVGVGVGFLAAAVVSAATIGTDPKRTGRDDVVAALGGGRQVVFVRYGAGHATADEWVYNDADPPAERVLWAHSAGPAADGRFSQRYPGRRRWLLTVGGADLRLVPYPPGS